MSMPAATPHLITADELLRLDLPNKSTELVRGQLVVREPPSTWHGRTSARLSYYLSDFVYRNDLGETFSQDTGFKIRSDPDTVRAPDVAFIRKDRLSEIEPRGYSALAPDLVIEVLSPDDRPGEVLEKVADWLGAGVRLVWVIDPASRQTRVHRADGTLELIGANEQLLGGDVLPGFSCALGDVLRSFRRK